MSLTEHKGGLLKLTANEGGGDGNHHNITEPHEGIT